MSMRTTTATLTTPATCEARGLFISFEGIDGAGKSSHMEPLAQAFRVHGRDVICTREPGGTPLAEQLRTLLLSEAMDPLTEALLAFAARRDHIGRVIAPALARGDVVLCDRFSDATFAYQGAGRGFSTDTLSTLETMVQSGLGLEPGALLEPHLTLWFDLAPAVAASRLESARAPDRFEQLDAAFFCRVAQGYVARAEAAPHRFARIDADRAPKEVWKQITQTMAGRGWLDNKAASGNAA